MVIGKISECEGVMKNKIQLFSHTDLDGYGCNIVLKSTLGLFSEIYCKNLGYEEINNRVKEFFNSDEFRDYKSVYITDISVNEEVAEIIEKRINETGIKVKLLDHHQSALKLNKYSWVSVEIEKNHEKVCGTSLLYDELNEVINYYFSNKLINNGYLFDFVENVRKYDTWLWHDKYNDIKPKQLNDLFYILGQERFLEKVISNLKCFKYNTSDFINENKLLLELQQERIDKYTEKKNNEIIEYKIGEYSVGVVFAEQFVSELGNKLSLLNPRYDLIAMVGGNSISYRTTKNNIDCSKVAKLFGGGGHQKASGSQISKENKVDIVKLIFNDNI